MYKVQCATRQKPTPYEVLIVTISSALHKPTY